MLMFGQQCVANRSLRRICAIKQLLGSDLKFHVHDCLWCLVGCLGRRCLFWKVGVFFFRMGLSVIVRVFIVQFATLNQHNAQYCYLVILQYHA